MDCCDRHFKYWRENWIALTQHCVVYADVDRLHVVNEKHGMHVGDEVIVAVAEIIRTNLGANVSASRISGDRFALFFLDTTSDDALPAVERLRDAIQTAVGTLGVDFGQGFAIGRPRPVEQVLQDLLRDSSGMVREPSAPATARPHRLVS